MSEGILYQQSDLKQLIDISDVTLEKLGIYHALLLKWNKAINLVSPKTIDQAWHRHFIDSAQLLPLIPPEAKIYADLGCGGGFPGLVLAIMHPDLEVHLVESDERKCQFMRTVARETETKVTIHTKRIEDAHDDFCPDFVTARALSSLEQLLTYCLPWAQNNPQFIFDYKSVPSVTDAAAKVVLLQNVSKKI